MILKIAKQMSGLFDLKPEYGRKRSQDSDYGKKNVEERKKILTGKSWRRFGFDLHTALASLGGGLCWAKLGCCAAASWDHRGNTLHHLLKGSKSLWARFPSFGYEKASKIRIWCLQNEARPQITDAVLSSTRLASSSWRRLINRLQPWFA